MNSEKWDKLCYYLSEKIQDDIPEREFEPIVEKGLEILGWSEFSGDFEIRPSFQLGSTKNSLKPDFLVKSNTNGDKLFVVEIKKPKTPLSKQNQTQLSTYMRQFKLPFGILIGPQIQIFYDGELNVQENAILIENIDFKRGNLKGEKFVELFNKENFNLKALNDFAANSLKKINRRLEIKKLTDKVLSENFKGKITELIKQYFVDEYDSELIDSVFQEINISVSPKNIVERKLENNNPILSGKNTYDTGEKYSRDRTKYIINGNGVKLPKNRFVLEFVREYIKNKPSDFRSLKAVFKDEFQGSTGVINELNLVKQKYSKSANKRHFVGDNEILTSSDNIRFVVSTEWSIDNVQNILKIAKREGFQIDEIENQ